jgi:hypothetical protein
MEFQLSPGVEQQALELLALAEDGRLTPGQESELERFTQLEHFLCMAKARARQIPRFEAMTCPDTARRLVESRASGRYESCSVNQMGRGIPRTKDKIRGHSGVFRN